jgi:flagellar protein FliO/FliZ
MKYLRQILLSLLVISHNTWAAEAMNTSSSNGVFKMICGLAIVLIVMAAMTWIIKRVLPNITNNQQAIARVISSVSVGSRERVVILQVADRWIVVGVAPGRVNSIANLEAGSQQHLAESTASSSDSTVAFGSSFAPSFSQWLQKSTAKLINHESGKVNNEK